MGTFADQVAAFAARTQDKADAVVREAIEEVGRRLIVRSPVDTTRFQSNWRYQAGAPDILFNDNARNVRVVNGIGDIPKAATAFTHFVSNSAPYATRLEHGYSQQAPAGMVGVTSLEWDAIIAGAVAKVNP